MQLLLDGSLQSKQEVMGRINHLIFFGMARATQKKTPPTILCFVYSLPREHVYRAVA
jgi:hypothetical protein